MYTFRSMIFCSLFNSEFMYSNFFWLHTTVFEAIYLLSIFLIHIILRQSHIDLSLNIMDIKDLEISSIWKI